MHAERKAQEQVWSKNHVVHLMHIYIYIPTYAYIYIQLLSLAKLPILLSLIALVLPVPFENVITSAPPTMADVNQGGGNESPKKIQSPTINTSSSITTHHHHLEDFEHAAKDDDFPIRSGENAVKSSGLGYAFNGTGDASPSQFHRRTPALVLHHHHHHHHGGNNSNSSGSPSSNHKKKRKRKKQKQSRILDSSSSSSSSSDNDADNGQERSTQVANNNTTSSTTTGTIHLEANSNAAIPMSPAMNCNNMAEAPATMISRIEPQSAIAGNNSSAEGCNSLNGSGGSSGGSIFIKKDYLPSSLRAQTEEKTRTTVSRVLSFSTPAKVEEKNSPSALIPGTPATPSTPVALPTSSCGSTSSATAPKEPTTPLTESKSSSNSTNTTATTGSTKKESSSSSEHRCADKSRCNKCQKRSKSRRSSSEKSRSSSGHRIGTVHRAMHCNPDEYKHLKYGKYFRREVYPNGGASVVHMYQDEIQKLPPDQFNELVDEFFGVVFAEDKNGFALNVMGIVHDAAAYLPDLLEHMAENYASLTVKAGVLGRNSDIETLTMMQYHEQVAKNYSQGTFRYGPLHQISLVGKVHEEVGGYFPDLLGRLEQSPFLKKVSGLDYFDNHFQSLTPSISSPSDNALGRDVDRTHGPTTLQ